MKVLLFVFFALGLSSASAADLRQRPVQSSESYESAIRNSSTSPSYVLISAGDAKTGQVRSLCTTANFVLGAIHREYGLGYDAADLAKAVDIALNRKDHTFLFQQQAALANIPSRYSDADLSAARAYLAPFSTAELKVKFSTLMGEGRLDTEGYARDAVACVLIERGLSPKLADISRQVYLSREEH